MPHDKPSVDPAELTFWEETRRRLNEVDRENPICLERVDQLLTSVPSRQHQEPLLDWLRRVRNAAVQDSKPVIPFRAKPCWRFTPLAEIQRLAADSGDSEIPLPDPGRALETEDGRFRLTITAKNGKLQLTVETLGLAVDSFANHQLGIAGPEGEEQLISILNLNEDGEDHCEIVDTETVRQALLHPIIGLIEDV